ncbi:BTAD domain-containing putative transcriptional regulator [Alisedimentitalea sp. MJ-SS2]|uniref:BTAD domain-containing putative transcriptional regulator n=1 Tax=Aliisedimentitalea sp. MJ-SS2 TaxID=3049795 RepID=UPI00290B86A9|nr:BTAD domain-containing putative transcriptional regulator [Alisedimentitalea sp. MJ-SS2]MDU8928615.1 BTAD domain-containing putative transcriptional regulator [Alisedimentitalea sp. MJ-SS2]
MSINSILARLLGNPEFCLGDGTILPVTPKLAALIAYLDASHPAMVPRAELIDVLWERMFARQARQTLRKAMERLRRIMGVGVVVTRGDLVGLNTARYESDTLVLDRFLRDDPDVAADSLLRIAPADFLAGTDIAGERWNDWLAIERRHRQDALQLALTRCARAGDGQKALTFAERAIRVNPMAEAPRRILMDLLARDGRASEAVQEYRAFARFLRDELDIDPSWETQNLMQSLSQQIGENGREGVVGRVARQTLTILPFGVLGNSRRGADLAAGLQTEIVTTLTKLSDLDIIDLSLPDALKGHSATVERPSDEQAVLKSALQVVGDRVRLTAQLVDCTSNRQIWAERFDRKLADILEIQDSLTKDIVTQLQVRLTEGEQARVWSLGTRSFEAWEAVVQATHLIHAHHIEGIREARQLAEGAIGIDPDYASAHAAVGWTHWVEGR